jgi:hypothetical protein
MLSDPVKFFDSLVRGVVLALYDFVMLSVASLAFPFVRKTVRFWPSVLAITKRLSALTLLLIWLSIFFSLSLTTDLGSLVGRFVSNHDAGSKSVQIIFSALVSTVIIDIATRAASLPIRNRQRRMISRELWQLSIAGVFFFASMLMLWPRDFFISRVLIFLQASALGIPDGFWLLFLPGLSVGLVVLWGFGFRGNKLRLAVMIALAFVLPALLLASQVTGSLALFAQVSPLLDSREPTKIVQSNSHCVAIPTPNRTPQTLKVITFLALDGGSDKTAVLPTDQLIVVGVHEDDGGPPSDEPPPQIGDFEGSTPEIVLSNGSYVRFELLANFDPSKNPEIANGAKFKCRLAYTWRFLTSNVIEDRTIKDWR